MSGVPVSIISRAYSGQKDNKCLAVAEIGDGLATIDMGGKLEGSFVPFGGTGSPTNTIWPRPRPTSVPSSIF